MSTPRRRDEVNSTQQAHVAWSDLWVDALLMVGAVFVTGISGAVDARAGCSEWFQRSGAVTVLLSGIVAFRSLSKHYQKLFNLPVRGTVLGTSRNQSIIDRATLFLSILGTAMWGYGDIIFKTP